jgi:serine/threonine protein kinase/tetratricopeptide (TPR) repeat protein
MGQSYKEQDDIGPYHLVQKLGEGGCGVAYLAEQSAPVRRQVALKIIKPGMDTKAVVARFEAERQALALMDHPNVARVFDAGATPAGRPYFVMELVRGSKITDYCDEHRLCVPDRLALFIQVCQAIQHAHQKSIIHRDIKPSNVLVAAQSGTAIAKVIDFGIAKATQGRLSDLTVFTLVDQFLGTPAYVSPEQTNPGSADIDTRADIYSLGVLLYELLTGSTPFDASKLNGDGLDRMRQRIRHEEPPTPSQRLGNLATEVLTHTAERRQSVPARLTKHIQGDLDWIVVRCLEKERTRRYQTANDLVLDLQRYLRHEPVLARPPSLAHVVRKFARRQRVMFAASVAASAFVIFAAAFAVVTSIQSQRIAAEQQRAEQQGTRAEAVSEFMLQIFDAAEPATSLGRDISARELLDEAGRRIRGDLRQHPEVRAQLLEAIGRSYRRLNQHEAAVAYLEDALRIRGQLPDPTGTKTGSVVIDLSIALRALGDLQRAQSVLVHALVIARDRKSDRTVIYGKLMLNLARVQFRLGDLTNARANLERSLGLLRQLLGSGHPEVADVLLQLGGVLIWQDELAAAERVSREANRIFSATRPPLHPERVTADTQLAYVLLLRQRIDEATPLLERSLIARTRLHGPESGEVASVLNSLGQVRVAQGRLDEAEDFLRRALRASERALGSEHNETAQTRTDLALLLAWLGKYREAEEHTRRALADFQGKLPPDHQLVASAEYVLGEVLLGAGRADEAETVLRTSMHRWERSRSPHWRVARTQSALGLALHRLGRSGEAEQYLTESYASLSTDHRADRIAREKARERVVRFYSDRGERQKLARLLDSP